MTKHTPGPWKVIRTLRGPLIRKYVTRDDLDVCIQIESELGKGSLCYAEILSTTSEEQTAHRNADLIAAAPDLLEAAKMAVKMGFKFEELNIYDALKMAIAKAEGK